MDPSVALGIRDAFVALETDPSATAKEVLLRYAVTLETMFAESKNIALYIFGIRSFFCWYKAQEILSRPADIKDVRDIWVLQNDRAYNNWLTSADDTPDALKWEKWCFQAKMAIFTEAVDDYIKKNASS